MFKAALKGIAVLAGSLLLGLVGMVVGAYIGGNFAESFVFNGVRGYEATGQLGFWVGIIAGVALGVLVLKKRSKRDET
jgi:tellurite resistance protein TehA-like permease